MIDISHLPENSGVYIFKDPTGKPIYIGKAANIRKRVKDHFDQRNFFAKDTALMGKTQNIETIIVDSEIEALILEANLIKKYKPAFNSQWKDDKDHLYIKITRDGFPKVLSVRKKNLKGAKIYFGPFPSASKVRTTLKVLRKIFPYSNCRLGQKRPCLHYHLGLCPGVCVGAVSLADYRKNIKKLIPFLQGKKDEVIRMLERDLQTQIKSMEFEKAHETQSKIEALRFITKPVRNLEFLSDDLDKVREKELSELADVLTLKNKPARIECYDISNISGKQATGSMVVFTNGLADHGEYRRFKIQYTAGPNDVGMISETLERRFKNDWPKPDLIVIDGGKGQLSAAAAVLEKFGLSIPVIALAKKMEDIYLPGENTPLRLSRKSSALKLVQRLRDEAHRFAITYHRKVRNREFFGKL